MSKNRIVLIVGALLLLIPLMGFPRTWENFFHIIFGISLVGLSFSVSLRQRVKRTALPKRARNTKEVAKVAVIENPVTEVETTPMPAKSEEPPRESEPVNKEGHTAEQTQI
jgi:hypothetical protein